MPAVADGAPHDGAGFLLPLGGLVPDQGSTVDQRPGKLVVAWRWTIPQHQLGITTPIYHTPSRGTSGILAAILAAMPRWMPPTLVKVAAHTPTNDYVYSYDAEHNGDPWTFAAQIIAEINA